MPPSEIKEKEETVSKRGVVRNFRSAAGLNNKLYRCGAIDKLANVVVADVVSVSEEDSNDDERDMSNTLTKSEYMILYEATMIIDLRSPFERNDEQIDTICSCAPGGKFVIKNTNSDDDDCEDYDYPPRRIVQIEMIKNLITYVSPKTVPNDEDFMNHFHRKDVLMEELDKRGGLVGLNELLLESNKDEFGKTLKLITRHLEEQSSRQQHNNNNNKMVVVHCTQGKDRTGLLIMLCQSILGISDDEIMADYHKSEEDVVEPVIFSSSSSSRNSKIAKSIAMSAPSEVMEATLDRIRTRYGSVSPGYLDDIGFDSSWRSRLTNALVGK